MERLRGHKIPKRRTTDQQVLRWDKECFLISSDYKTCFFDKA